MAIGGHIKHEDHDNTIVFVGITLSVIFILSVILMVVLNRFHWKPTESIHRQQDEQQNQEQLIQETPHISNKTASEQVPGCLSQNNSGLVKQEFHQKKRPLKMRKYLNSFSSNSHSGVETVQRESYQTKRLMIVDQNGGVGDELVVDVTKSAQAKSHRNKRYNIIENRKKKNMIWMSLSKINKSLVDMKGILA